MLGTNAGFAARLDLSPVGKETSQCAHVFIVNLIHLSSTKGAYLTSGDIPSSLLFFCLWLSGFLHLN